MQEGEDRSYMVDSSNGSVEVRLTGKTVKWLLKLNVKRREDKSVDKAFIKAILIAVFKAQFIKDFQGSVNALDENLVLFIKGSLIYYVQ